MTERLEYADYTPEGLAGLALNKVKTEKEKGHIFSNKAALGLVFQQNGREIIKRTLDPISERGTVAEDLSSLLAGLSPEGRRQFLLGLGGVYLGTAIETLEWAVVDGWEDELFIDNYNRAIVGTQLPQLKLEVLNGLVGGRRRTPREETILIRQELGRDLTFLGFFDRKNRNSLPQIVRACLYGTRYSQKAMSLIVSLYQEAVKFLP